MAAETGQFALILAFLLALFQASLPLVGLRSKNAGLIALARPLAVGQFSFIAAAFACLIYVFAVSDFSVVTVVQNSHSAKPLIYKITGAWGNHEGSMLLWILIMSLFGAATALFGHRIAPGLLTRTLSVQGMIGAAFLAFILFTSNPFARAIPPAADGQGLNPLLQDPGLIIHPPFLYLGYVGFSIVFSFAVAALLQGKVDAAWARWVRPWALAAWSFLTIGIALGSWWAYYELGWGGWWYWDPVENASFMPWLLGTAFIHSLLVLEKRETLKSWTILLAILTFAMSLIGTFLVRSGILTSVHAFAVDPARGVFILALLVLAIGGSLTLFAMRAPKLVPSGSFRPISREGSILLNNLLMVSGFAVVFLGTFYPLFIDAISGQKISVGPPYFNMTFVPLMIPMLITMAVAPLLPWKKADLGAVFARMRWILGITLVAMAVAAWVQWRGAVFAFVGLGVAVWVVAGTLTSLAERVQLFRVPLSRSLARAAGLRSSIWGMAIAHIGTGLLVAAITGVSLWKVERILTMSPGQEVAFAGYQVKLRGVETFARENYQTREATFHIRPDGGAAYDLTTERRFYPVRETQTTEAGIGTSILDDLYVTIGDEQRAGQWNVHLYHYPLAPFLWISAFVMVLGGALAASDRRYPARETNTAQPLKSPVTKLAGAAPGTAG